MLFTLIRIASTHRVFSQTFDENIHIAAGYERLTSGRIMDPEHPPLARVLFALPFRTFPMPSAGEWEWYRRGNELIGHGGDYVRNLAHARLGNLVFVLAGLFGVTWWGWLLFGRSAAVCALILFASLPPVLAHGGLATTDMAGAAALPCAAAALHMLLERVTWSRAFLLAIATGLGLLTKMSFVPFFGMTVIVMLIARRRLPLRHLAASFVVAAFIVWAAYSFTIGTMAHADAGAAPAATRVFGSPRLASITLPAPMYWVGLLLLEQHDIFGHEAYLLGHVSTRGWWYYFPIAFAVKTPLPFLIVAACAAVLAIRRRQHAELIVIAAGILAISMTSHINIGVRHILPMYAPLAVLGGWIVTEWRRITAPLAIWLVIGSAIAHPDYLPWMNVLAGRDPSRVLADSNYDWGQDLLRLARECRKRNIHQLGATLFTTADTSMFGMPQRHEIAWHDPETGWIAISATQLRVARAKDPNAFSWLLRSGPYETIGKTIRLYFVSGRSSVQARVRARASSRSCSRTPCRPV